MCIVPVVAMQSGGHCHAGIAVVRTVKTIKPASGLTDSRPGCYRFHYNIVSDTDLKLLLPARKAAKISGLEGAGIVCRRAVGEGQVCGDQG
jgi:hypothetical protein